MKVWEVALTKTECALIRVYGNNEDEAVEKAFKVARGEADYELRPRHEWGDMYGMEVHGVRELDGHQRDVAVGTKS